MAASTRHRAVALGLLVAVVALAGCSLDTGDESADEPESGIVTPAPAPTSDTVAAPTPEGNVVNRLALEVGTCFNDYTLDVDDSDEVTEITTEVDCRRPHGGEVYASHSHPGDAGTPFPGNVEMERWATEACYHSFEEFVGRQYELSELEIGVIRPTEETWSDPVGLHRQVLCFVRAPDGAQLSGSMDGIGL